MPSNKLLQAAAGSAGGDNLFVEDVFSTYVYTGNTSNPITINNGIDFSGEGGLFWAKARSGSSTQGHALLDTVRGTSQALASETSNASVALNSSKAVTYNNNGITIPADTTMSTAVLNYSGFEMASWSFRKAEGFFDVVTYTGNGTSGRTVAHSLGSVPKMVIVKNISLSGYNWQVYHTSTGNTDYLNLNDADATASFIGAWNNTSPTSTHFTLGNWAQTNDAAGSTYVAYLFGDDAVFGEDGDEQICKIGSYTGNGTVGRTVDFGFEPQWVLIKPNTNDDWYLFDTMREWTTDISERLRPNTSDEGNRAFYYIPLNATGITFNASSGGALNVNGREYIYMAIRRPMKVPEAGTEVFSTVFRTATAPTFYTGFVTDMQIYTYLNGFQKSLTDRLRGQQELLTNANNAESATGTQATYDWMTGVGDQDSASSNTIAWNFKRAPKFMDVIAYSGTNSAHTEVHNLNAVPQLMFVKDRDAANSWVAYSAATGPSICGFLNSTSDFFNVGTAYFNSTNPTSSVVTIGSNGSVNASGRNYIAYLFATLEGVSKVGSYEGNGSGQNIDCGFSNGARFVLLKDVDDSAHWNVYDTTRGISTGTSYQLSLNNSDAQSGATDQIEPYSGGFKVKTNAGTNASGHTFIFLAIA